MEINIRNMPLRNVNDEFLLALVNELGFTAKLSRLCFEIE